MDADSEELIRQAQSGDRTAFARLLDRYYNTLFSIACHYCGQRQDAEDVTHQACIKLARSLGQYRFEASFSTWLYRVVINCAKDWYRAHPPATQELTVELAGSDSSEHSVLLGQVLGLVEAMGDGFRDTLSLVVGEGLSHAEAAQVLSVKESTISWRLHEIRKRLNADHEPLERGQ